jgi:hypothetical protein
MFGFYPNFNGFYDFSNRKSNSLCKNFKNSQRIVPFERNIARPIPDVLLLRLKIHSHNLFVYINKYTLVKYLDYFLVKNNFKNFILVFYKK